MIDNDIIKDEDIITAYEYCLSHNCRNCPLDGVDNCRDRVEIGIPKIYNRQKAEIERLQEYYKLYYERQKEIEELNVQLEHLNGNLKFVRGTAERQLDEIKRKDKQIEELVSFQRFCEAKAIKEFAERVKVELTTGAAIMRLSTLDIIDNLAKEMTEGVNGDG